MSVHDYLIDHNGFDWSSLFENWAWLVPKQFTVWLMNRFGDLFLVFEDGTVHMMDVGRGTIEQVADSRDHFGNKIDEDNNANNWLMIPLIDQLVKTGITLKEGRCYSYKQLPILGGDYTVENACVLPIKEHLEVCGSIHQQLQNIPDGTEVVIKVV